MTTTTDLRTALATGQPVKLHDLVSARRVAARESAEERKRQIAEAQEAARIQAELEAQAARNRAERDADVEALRSMDAHGVYLRCEDGGLSYMGGLSDIDQSADGTGEIVEVEYDSGHRRWLDRADVVLV